MLSIIVPYEFQMLVFSLYSNLVMNAQSTIDGFNVFDQFDYTVMYFFPVVKAERDESITCLHLLQSALNMVFFFLLICQFPSFVSLKQPKRKKKKIKEKKIIKLVYTIHLIALTTLHFSCLSYQ